MGVLVLTFSVVAGVAVGLASAAMTSDQPPPAPPETRAAPKPDVEMNKPVLVANDDGGATLSATLVNHTDTAIRIDRAVGGQKDAQDPPFLLVYGTRSRITIPPGEPMRIGGVGDAYRLRFTDRVQVGSTLPVTLYFGASDIAESGPTVSMLVPVVARDAAHGAVANNGPNTEITVEDAVIVVVPGQEEAYVGGYITSTIDDSTERRPTAVGPQGLPIDYLHQTATGGPSGVGASKSVRVSIGRAPYVDDGGDRDYVRAGDVTVGETVTVTMRFPSGDVVTKFKVVQGRADGTI